MYVVEYTGIPLFPLAKWYSSLETASQYSYPSSAINDGTTYRTALTQLLLFRNLGPTSKYDTTSQYGQSEACSRHMQRLRVPRPSAAATHSPCANDKVHALLKFKVSKVGWIIGQIKCSSGRAFPSCYGWVRASTVRAR